MTYYLGIDVSKGRMDAVMLREEVRSASIVKQWKLDDTPRGWACLVDDLIGILDKDADAELIVGCEWTGGYERRWLELVSCMKTVYGDRITVYGIHGQDIAHYSRLFRNRCKTDMVSAEIIARYLMAGKKEGVTEFDPSQSDARLLLSLIRHYSEELQRKTNYLHQLVHRFYPFILYDKSTRSFPQYILDLLIAYPRPELLIQTPTDVLTRIPYLSKTRARELKEQARAYLAFFKTSPLEGELIRSIASDVSACRKKLRELEAKWKAMHASSRAFELLMTIPGIGPLTALVLVTLMGSIHRFPTRAKFVAFFGLAPQYDKSGDKVKRRHISKRGASIARKYLYMAAMAAIRESEKFKKLYEHHLKKSNHYYAITCVMHHLLRVAYAILTTEQPYDPNYKPRARTSSSASSSSASADAPSSARSSNQPELTVVNDGPHAPVSSMERSKRKKQQESSKQASPPRPVYCKNPLLDKIIKQQSSSPPVHHTPS